MYEAIQILKSLLVLFFFLGPLLSIPITAIFFAAKISLKIWRRRLGIKAAR